MLRYVAITERMASCEGSVAVRPSHNTPRPVSEQRETPGNETLSCGARYHG